MKKKLALALTAFLSLVMLCSCGSEPDHKECISEIVKLTETNNYSYSITKLKGHETYVIDFYNWNIPQSHSVWEDCHQEARHLIRLEITYYS